VEGRVDVSSLGFRMEGGGWRAELMFLGLKGQELMVKRFRGLKNLGSKGRGLGV
jgi:hypothetical protein